MRLWACTALILSAVTSQVAARDLQLSLPVDCTLSEGCYIQQFVDHDPSEAARDAFCGPQTYDGHKGTDFAVPTLRDMARGVDVLAAAAGTIVGVRDEMADVVHSATTADDVRGRECGNGVLIDHGDGWQTQYCHLKRGSVAVAPGDRVETGAILGEIGLSGLTEFPHMHLSVRKDGAVVDPFDPDRAINCATPETDTLWASPITPQPGGLLDIGFATAVPDYADVKAGTAALPSLAPNDPALVMFVYAFGVRAGDEMMLQITGPRGVVAEQVLTLEKNKALMFRAIGKRTKASGWPNGLYSATATLRRAGQVVDDISGKIWVD